MWGHSDGRLWSMPREPEYRTWQRMDSAPASDLLLSRTSGVIACVGVLLGGGYGLRTLGITLFEGWGWAACPVLAVLAYYVSGAIRAWVLKVREVGRRPKLPPL
jgi:hypothetical protein